MRGGRAELVLTDEKMKGYVLKRTGQMILVVFLLSIFIFLLVSMIPGDPVYAMLGEEVSQEEYNRVFHELKLDQPVIVRYFSWLADALRGDLGESTQFHMRTSEVLAARIPITLFFSISAFIISVPFGILFGVISAVNRGKPLDTVVTLIANVTACLPQFWFALLIMFVFAMKLGWLPSYGFDWPCLSLGGIASTTRQTRSSMLEVIRQDYIRTARSKGIANNKVIYLHALKNALIPVITILGMRLGNLIAGSMFVESVFNIPGMGSLMVKAIQSRDIPVVQACVLAIALVSCIVNLVTDILYAVVDPRVRFE